MNEDRLTANVVKRLLDESAGQVPPHIQDRLKLAISKSVQLHAEKHGQHAKSRQPNAIPAEDGIEQWMDSLPADFTTSI